MDYQMFFGQPQGNGHLVDYSSGLFEQEPLLMQTLSAGKEMHNPLLAPQLCMMPGGPLNGELGIKKKPIILDEGKKRYAGRLKFFDEVKNYGFIIMDEDGSDIFVHYDDLSKANLQKEYLRTAKKGNNIRLSFCCLSYIGKHNRSKKAVDLKLLPN